MSSSRSPRPSTLPANPTVRRVAAALSALALVVGVPALAAAQDEDDLAEARQELAETRTAIDATNGHLHRSFDLDLEPDAVVFRARSLEGDPPVHRVEALRVDVEENFGQWARHERAIPAGNRPASA